MTEREWDLDDNNILDENPQYILYRHATTMGNEYTTTLYPNIDGPESIVSSSGVAIDTSNNTISLDPTRRTTLFTLIQFDMRETTWGETFGWMLSWVFAPVMILWSKLIKRPVGIQCRRR